MYSAHPTGLRAPFLSTAEVPYSPRTASNRNQLDDALLVYCSCVCCSLIILTCEDSSWAIAKTYETLRDVASSKVESIAALTRELSRYFVVLRLGLPTATYRKVT